MSEILGMLINTLTAVDKYPPSSKRQFTATNTNGII